MALSIDQLKYALVTPGHITADDFSAIEAYAQEQKITCEQAFVVKSTLKRNELGEGLAFAYGVPYSALDRRTLSDEVLRLIPERVAALQQALVIETREGVYSLATAHPDHALFINALSRKYGVQIEVYYALPDDIDRALLRYAGGVRDRIASAIRALENESVEHEPAHAVVDLVNTVLATAFETHASDVHLEPSRDHGLIRFRIDGVLEQVGKYPKHLHEKICARVKILGGLRTDEQSAPQDGRFTFEFGVGQIGNARVSLAPVVEGENVVMRLLHEEVYQLTPTDLGLSDTHLEILTRTAQKPHGMILAVGPTGSGKTTTLYSILKTLNTGENNIMTIEDPVEYRIEHIQQIQVNPAKDLHFSTGLRTIVRQDPDIILVGEIRDAETADIAVNAAMTGHLVLSSMHTNDAGTTFPRLTEMGIEPFLVASSVNLIIAQRLVRIVCGECRKSLSIDSAMATALNLAPMLRDEILRQAGKTNLDEVIFFEGLGCSACDGVGYQGRVGVFELLVVDEFTRPLILQRASAQEITVCAQEHGMQSMLQDGVSKVLAGTTTLEELFRSVYA
jgi:type IV pilus assembly protein PilB